MLGAIEDVQVLALLVQLTILEFAETVLVSTFQQHAGESVQKVEIFWRGIQREWVDLDAASTEPQLQVATLKQRGQLSEALPEIEDHRHRVVLLRMRHQKVQQEALAAARCAQDKAVADVVDVKGEVKRRAVARLKDG